MISRSNKNIYFLKNHFYLNIQSLLRRPQAAPVLLPAGGGIAVHRLTLQAAQGLKEGHQGAKVRKLIFLKKK